MRDSHIARLLSSNKELSDTLQQRDHQIIAYQNEANVMERRNRELESKIRQLEPKLSKLQQQDHQIIAYQNEANVLERRNRELESKIRDLEPKLSKLQQRDHQIIALQNEANAMEHRNRDLEYIVRELESKLSHFKSTQGRKRKDEESETVKELNEHIKKQSMMIVDLRREQDTQSVSQTYSK